MFQVYIYTLGMLVVICNILAVLNISKFSFRQRRAKWFWTNVVLVLPLIGLLFYVFIGKNSLANGEEDQ